MPTPWVQETKHGSDAPVLEEEISLAAEVRKCYPDLSQAPAGLRLKVERVEKAAAQKAPTRNLTETVVQAYSQLDSSQSTIAAIKEARAAHRKRWMGHLESSVQSWKDMVESYESQKARYRALLDEAKAKAAQAIQEIEVLNQRAGTMDVAPTRPDPASDSDAVEDKEEAQQREAVHQQLTLTMQAIAGPGPILVDSEDGEDKPKIKRARSKDRGKDQEPDPMDGS